VVGGGGVEPPTFRFFRSDNHPGHWVYVEVDATRPPNPISATALLMRWSVAGASPLAAVQHSWSWSPGLNKVIRGPSRWQPAELFAETLDPDQGVRVEVRPA
jgi:hypothetical protein